MKVIAIVQARSTSTRFPKKVLLEINRKTIIEILFRRLNLSKEINKIVFAMMMIFPPKSEFSFA